MSKIPFSLSLFYLNHICSIQIRNNGSYIILYCILLVYQLLRVNSSKPA